MALWRPCQLNLLSCIPGCVQGQSTYSRQIKQVEDDIQNLLKKINELTGMYCSSSLPDKWQLCCVIQANIQIEWSTFVAL